MHERSIAELDRTIAGQPRRLARQLLFAAFLLAVLALEALAMGGGRGAAGILLISGLFPTFVIALQSVIERLLPAAGPRKSVESWLLHFQISIFFSVMSGITTAAAFISCSLLARRFGFELGLFDIRFASGKGLIILLASIWLSAVAADFFFYWYHRTLHKSHVLWQHHKMHHTDTELEAVSTTRQNWIETVFVSLFITVPMILLFKVDPSDQWGAGILIGLTTSSLIASLTLSHMNVRWHVGWASALWCSPQIHRIHHSLEPRHIDKNFAFVFPFWDVLFGTYYHPRKDEFPGTGVAGEGGFGSFWEAEIYTQREWLKVFKAWRNRQRTGDA